MKAIVNVNKSWGIGKDGGLLINLPEDMKFFRETTAGKTVVMGRKTLESFPGGRPLKGRTNIVLTREPEKITPFDDGSTRLMAVGSREEALSLLKKLLPEGDGGTFIIGGEKIYRLFLNDCDTCLVTENDCKKEADSFFPDLSREPGWSIYKKGEIRQYGGVSYSFDIWKKEN